MHIRFWVRLHVLWRKCNHLLWIPSKLRREISLLCSSLPPSHSPLSSLPSLLPPPLSPLPSSPLPSKLIWSSSSILLAHVLLAPQNMARAEQCKKYTPFHSLLILTLLISFLPSVKWSSKSCAKRLRSTTTSTVYSLSLSTCLRLCALTTQWRNGTKISKRRAATTSTFLISTPSLLFFCHLALCKCSLMMIRCS